MHLYQHQRQGGGPAPQETISTQYFSYYPDYKFDRLRKEAESMNLMEDSGTERWIKMKIREPVQHAQAKLYLNDNPQPVLTW
jgi:hypothetical protein